MIAATLNDNTGVLASLTTSGELGPDLDTGVGSCSSGGAKLLPFPAGSWSTSFPVVASLTRGGDGVAVDRQRRECAGSTTTSAGSTATSPPDDSMFAADASRRRSAELRRLFAVTQPASRVINLVRRRRRASETCLKSRSKLSSEFQQLRNRATGDCGACFSSRNVCIQTPSTCRQAAVIPHRPRLPGVRPMPINLTDSSNPATGRSLQVISSREEHGRADHYTSISESRQSEVCGNLCPSHFKRRP